jgi:hypothetical protein
MPKRKYGSKRGKPPKPYRSWFEHGFHQRYNQLEYEPHKFTYWIERQYTPDFVSPCGKYWFELKGFMRAGDSQKYKAIKKYLDDREVAELIFIFQDPNKKMHGAQRRKDGSFNTVGEWARKAGFTYCTENTFKKREWLK